MSPPKTVPELYEKMALSGYFTPATELSSFVMPTVLRTVPAITTYGTPALPLNTGVHVDAGLEIRSQRDCG